MANSSASLEQVLRPPGKIRSCTIIRLKLPVHVSLSTIPAPIPAEADAVPSKTYRAIISSKMLKGKAGTIGGIASGQGNSECGSFFNKGDNRVLRTVYKEDIQSQSVSSLSFNPVKWVCAACPKSHPVFGGGRAREPLL